jgi:hypothetical protein
MSQSLPIIGGHPSGFGASQRTDNWRVGPFLTFSGFMAFIVYTTWAALQGEHFTAGPYLSPFYSPLLFAAESGEGMPHAIFGAWPDWWPALIPASPAVLILMFPGAFRFTCYYYRKAYYRAFAGSPPGCGVVPLAEGKKYNGETKLMVFQNLHRYSLYFALPYIPILYYDAILACSHDGELGFGLGTVIMFVNATLIACYTCGCHSFRHLIGGRSDCMSCGQNTVRYGNWKRVSWLNGRHMLFAWCSLFSVGLTDAYIRLVSMGVLTDINTWS